MRSSLSLRVASAVALSAGAALFCAAALPAAHATDYVGVYATFSDVTVDANDDTVYTGTISFPNTDLPSGTFITEFSGSDSSNYAESHDNSSEWLAADTPIGQIFGASGPSDTNLFLKVGIGTDITERTVITFDAPFPADRLGIAIGDFDMDTVTVSATDADGNDVSRGGLYGSSTNNAFNLCAVSTMPDVCTDETAVPVVTDTLGSVTFAPDVDGTDIGVTGWLAPNTDITSIAFDHSNANTPESTVRFWIAGLATPTTPSATPSPSAAALATTGSTGSAGTLWAATMLSLLGIAGLATAAIRKVRA